MGLRFSISRKIGTGFGLFIVVVGVVFYITSNTLSESREINRRINDFYAPSIRDLEELDNQLIQTHQLMKQWAYVQRREDDHERTLAVNLCEEKIPAQLRKIDNYTHMMTEEQAMQKNLMFVHVRELLIAYDEIMHALPDFDSYYDPINQMAAEGYFIEDGVIPTALKNATESLSKMNSMQRNMMAMEIAKMNDSFQKLRLLLVNIAFGVLFAGIVIAVLTSRSIVRPINSLKYKLQNLSRGIYSVHTTKTGNDEIGDMANAVNVLIRNFEKTKEFSLNVGAGNFNVPYEPLSEHDELGMALLRMKDDLASYRHEMEEKVDNQTREIRQQRDEVESQRQKVTELYTDLQSSIDYAKRLQQTILPGDAFVKSMFPESFVLFKPKATVSGDFYWFAPKGRKRLFAAADCTGHGVPGAFMSLVGHNVLNQATKVYSKPSQILNSANRLSAEAMRADSGEHFMKDGMDIAFCCFDTENYHLEFSGAHNPAYVVRDGELMEMDSDPYSIGTYVNGEKEYTNHSMVVKPGDIIYLFSDGYADQFGGPRGKKYMRRRFKEYLLSISGLKMEDQKRALDHELRDWIGDGEQIDDILVLGVKIV